MNPIHYFLLECQVPLKKSLSAQLLPSKLRYPSPDHSIIRPSVVTQYLWRGVVDHQFLNWIISFWKTPRGAPSLLIQLSSPAEEEIFFTNKPQVWSMYANSNEWDDTLYAVDHHQWMNGPGERERHTQLTLMITNMIEY